MGSVDLDFARDLRARLHLTRAIETGTYRGLTARSLATIFPEVVTIELSHDLAESAKTRLADVTNIRVVEGHSVRCLAAERDAAQPTLYFLDGHWSGGQTEGVEDECPLLEEVRTIGAGHSDDCLLIDDARLFASAPPPPHRPGQWPELAQVFDLLRELHPDHVVTLINDQVLAVPRSCKPDVDAYGLRVAGSLSQRIIPLIHSVRQRVRR